MAYIASNWYWLGQPAGQPSIIYSSARGAVVPPTDLAYVAWSLGNFATAWPKDETGAVTVAALDDELVRAGLPATGLTAPTVAQLQASIFAKVASLLNASRPYTVAGVTPAISCDCGPSLNDVQEAFDWGSIPNQTGTLPWIDNAFTNFSLTPAEVLAFANAVGAYKQSVYAEAATVNQGVKSGSITTLAQIASAAWPT